MRLIAFLLVLVAALNAFAGETVYLNSGFSLVADSHTRTDGRYVFHVGAGTLEVPEKDVSEIVASPLVPAIEKALIAPAPDSLKPQIVLASAARIEGVDTLFLNAVAKVESCMRQDAISRKGALGLMQLMPGTAASLGVDPAKADENASGGARYLRSLLERYNYDPVLTLAAYNAGPGAVTKYRGVPPYYETRTYVVRVLKEYERELKSVGVPPSHPVRSSSSVIAKTPSAIN